MFNQRNSMEEELYQILYDDDVLDIVEEIEYDDYELNTEDYDYELQLCCL